MIQINVVRRHHHKVVIDVVISLSGGCEGNKKARQAIQ
jgi:hypothetical protein